MRRSLTRARFLRPNSSDSAHDGGLPEAEGEHSFPRRHDFAWLEVDACVAAAKADEQEYAAQWIRRGLPVVVTRRDSALLADELGLGIALSPKHGRMRIGFTARLQSVRRTAPPPHLNEVIASAPRRWRAGLLDLAGNAEALGIELRVYGSFAWQHFIGERYVTRSSDIDLLWQAGDRARLARGLMLLSSCEFRSGLRFDGEIVWPDGAAIAWREMSNPRNRVLVKYPASVALQDSDALLARLPAR